MRGNYDEDQVDRAGSGAHIPDHPSDSAGFYIGFYAVIIGVVVAALTYYETSVQAGVVVIPFGLVLYGAYRMARAIHNGFSVSVIVEGKDEERVKADWGSLALAAIPIMLVVVLVIEVLAIDSSLRPW